MVKLHKKLLVLFLCVAMVFTGSFSVFAENSNSPSDEDTSLIKAVIQQYFDRYYETLKTGNYIEVSELFTDSDEAIMPQRILKNHLLLFKEFGRSYDFYELKLDFKDIRINKNTAKVEMFENANYKYNVAPADIITRISNIDYTVELENVNGSWKISAIDSKDNLNYDYAANELKKYDAEKSKKTKKQYITDVFNEKDNYTKSLKSSLEKNYKLGASEDTRELGANTNGLTALATYSYDADKGIRYARAYANISSVPADKVIFAPASPDCTNFVSQCLWAAYGGWDEANVTNSRNNVYNKVRMTSDWYGAKVGYGAISNAFAGVPYLYDYVTGPATTGPNGTGYGEASTSTFNLGNVWRADVIQFYSNSYGNWRHSVFVSHAYRTAYETLILVCAHSGEAYDEDIVTYLNNPDKIKARGIHFSSASF